MDARSAKAQAKLHEIWGKQRCCRHCLGDGQVDGEICPVCRGQAWIPAPDVYAILWAIQGERGGLRRKLPIADARTYYVWRVAKRCLGLDMSAINLPEAIKNDPYRHELWQIGYVVARRIKRRRQMGGNGDDDN